MSQFDPSTFLDATIDAPMTKRKTLPEGDYLAQIGDIEARAWQGKKDPTKSGMAYDVPLTLQIPMELQEELGYSELKLSDSIMLDLTPQGTIDIGPGRNGRLRMYREALDLNKPGTKFSARMMSGQLVKVSVKHELYDAADGTQGISERVRAVGRA